MDTRQRSWTIENLGITTATITARVGYRAQQTPTYFKELVAKLLEACAANARVKGGFRVLPPTLVSLTDEGLRLDAHELAISPLVHRVLRQAKIDRAALFVATAGPAMTTWYDSFAQAGQLLEAYVVDTIGSVLAEAAAEAVAEELRCWAAEQDLGTTNRYSPGYCRWDVAEQHVLFELLPPEFCGVTLTASALMRPMKSVSGLIGIGPEARRSSYGCRACHSPCLHGNALGGAGDNNMKHKENLKQ
jgi:hypothetical protein